jgi:hypothetical protein
MPDHSAAHEIVVLAALAGIPVQLRHPGVKIPRQAAQTQAAKQVHIESKPTWNTPVVVPVVPGFVPPNSSDEFSLKLPRPPPALTQGEIPLWGRHWPGLKARRKMSGSPWEQGSAQTKVLFEIDDEGHFKG